jgi:hypothetical protein
MRRAMRSGLISEATIKAALNEARGDLFLASCALDCTAQELDKYIRRSPVLQAFASTVEQVKNDPAYDRMSAEQFEAQVTVLSRAYKLDGLNVIHELATMSYGDSAALAKVKLDAARALRGDQGHGSADTSAEATLLELNQLYQQNAPRIKEIRTTVVTLTDERAPSPITFELPRNS